MPLWLVKSEWSHEYVEADNAVAAVTKYQKHVEKETRGKLLTEDPMVLSIERLSDHLVR